MIKRLGLALIMIACCSPLFATPLKLDKARIPAAPPTATVMAAYFTLSNAGTKTIHIRRFSSPAFKKIEIHQTVVDKTGMARMRPVNVLKLKPKTSLVLKPNSYHLMLFNPKKALPVGTNVTLIIHLESKQTVRVTLPVVARQSNGHHDHKHHH